MVHYLNSRKVNKYFNGRIVQRCSIQSAFQNKGNIKTQYIPKELRNNNLYQNAIRTIYQNGSPYLNGISDDNNMSVQLNFSSLEAAALFLDIITDSKDPNIRGKLTQEKYVQQQLEKYTNTVGLGMFYFTFRVRFDDSLYQSTPPDGYCGWSVIEQATRRQQEKRSTSKSSVTGLKLQHRHERNVFLNFWKHILPDIKDETLQKAISSMMDYVKTNQGTNMPSSSNLWFDSAHLPDLFSNYKDTSPLNPIESNAAFFNKVSITEAILDEKYYEEIKQGEISKPSISTYKLPSQNLDDTLGDWSELFFYSPFPDSTLEISKLGSLDTIKKVIKKPNYIVFDTNHYWLHPVINDIDQHNKDLQSCINQVAKKACLFRIPNISKKAIDHAHATSKCAIANQPSNSPITKGPSPIKTMKEVFVLENLISDTDEITGNQDDTMCKLPCTPNSNESIDPRCDVSDISLGQIYDNKDTISQPIMSPAVSSSLSSSSSIIDDIQASWLDVNEDGDLFEEFFSIYDGFNYKSGSSKTNNTSPEKCETDILSIEHIPLIEFDWEDLGLLNLLPNSLEFIPTGIRNQLRALMKLLLDQAEIAMCNRELEKAELAYKKWVLLPSCLLLHITNTTRMSKKSVIRERIQKIIDDDWSEFTIHNMSQLITPSSKHNLYDEDTLEKLRHKRIIKLAANNNISKAYKNLQPMVVAPVKDEMLEILRSLHPSRLPENEVLYQDSDSIEYFHFTSSEVRETITSYAKGTMHGVSKLRAEHLKSLIGCPSDTQGEELCVSITNLLNRVANGILPPGYTKFLACGNLISLQKSEQNSRDIRPIAMGELIRKLAGRLMLKNSKGEIEDFFKGIQFGVGTKNGIEKIFHAITAFLEINPDYDLLISDFINAFNTLFRKYGAATISERFPKFVGYFRSFYQDPSSLFVTDRPNYNFYKLSSEEGSPQGCTGATFHYCAGTQPLLTELSNIAKAETSSDDDTISEDNNTNINKSSNKKGQVLALIDDIIAAVPHDKGKLILKHILQEGPKYGLILKPSKTMILLGQCESSEEANKRQKSYMDILSLPEIQLCDSCAAGQLCSLSSECGVCRNLVEKSNVLIHPENITNLIHKSAQERVYGVRLLGSPYGTPAFCQLFLNKIMSKVEDAAERVSSFSDLQTSWIFYSKVLQAKITHILRTIPPSATKEFTSSFDDTLDQTLLQILGIPELSDKQWLQASLSIKDGGLGRTSFLGVIRLTAYLSSISCTSQVIRDLVPEVFEDCYSGHYQFNWSCEIFDAAKSFLWRLSDPDSVPSTQSVQEFVCKILNNTTSQEQLTQMYYDSNTEALFDNILPTWPKADIARFNSLYRTDAGAWLHALPRYGETKMSNEVFRTSLLTYLGCDYSFIPIGLCCDCKNATPISKNGDHFHSCAKGVERINKHDKIRDLTISLATQGGIKCSLEPKHCFPLQSGKYKNIRPDACLFNPHLSGSVDGSKPILLDISITHPCTKSIVDKAAKERLAAADTAYKDKIKKYITDVNDEISKGNLDFLPIIFESFGAVHPISLELISKLIKKASVNTGIPFHILKCYWLRRFAVTLQTGQATMLLERTSRTIKSSCLIKDVTCKEDWLPQ